MKAQRLERIARFRGCDWFPSWARSPVDYWTASMQREAATRELGFVGALGLDHVRVWLSAHGYEQDPQAYVDNIGFLLDAAGALGLSVVMELFDSCGTEPRVDASTVRVEDVVGLAGGDPRLDVVRGLGGDVLEGPALVEVPWRGDPSSVVWEWFVPNPGYDLLGPQHRPRWDAYASDVVAAVRDHPALAMLEVMNEPFVTQLGVDVDRAPITDFLAHAHGLVRELAPDVPLSVGAETPDAFAAYEACLAAPLDVVSFHSFREAGPLAGDIASAKRIAGDRPVYCSEWGYFPGGDDAAQLAAFRERLPVLAAAGIGWAAAHLVAGYGPFGNAALLYPSGVMRPSAMFLRDALRRS